MFDRFIYQTNGTFLSEMVVLKTYPASPACTLLFFLLLYFKKSTNFLVYATTCV